MEDKKVIGRFQSAEKRVTNFEEVELGYNDKEALQEANRCLQCVNPRCMQGCPVSIHIPEFIKRIREGDLKGAYEVISKSSSLPAVCGRVCPQEKQCEAMCIKGLKGDAIAIGSLERYVADQAIINEFNSVKPEKKNGKKVAIVGSGPAGLTCAFYLKVNGFDVTIYEKHDYLGGLLNHGIPEFRLDREVLNNTINRIIDLGIDVKYNMELGNNLDINELEKDYDAIFIGIGANLSNKMNIPGEDKINVIPGNEFLEEKQVLDLTNKKVIVSGGGNVAIDVARTTKRMGADVTIVYRRDEDSMPANRVEINDAKNEGINFLLQTNILEVLGEDEVDGIKVIKTELVPTDNGRPKPVNIDGSEYEIPCDYVFMAIGSHADDNILSKLNIELENGYIKKDLDGLTSNSKIYSGGDIANDNNTVAFAAFNGRKAAFSIIDRFNENKA